MIDFPAWRRLTQSPPRPQRMRNIHAGKQPSASQDFCRHADIRPLPSPPRPSPWWGSAQGWGTQRTQMHTGNKDSVMRLKRTDQSASDLGGNGFFYCLAAFAVFA